MLICLDAGHYLGTPGKRCLKRIDPGETREWQLNNRIAGKVETRLAAYDCRVMRVDDVTGLQDVYLSQRVEMANEAGADVYISIHHNAGIKGRSGGGIVIFVAPACSSQSKVLQEAVYRHTVDTTGLRGNRANPTPERGYYVLKHTKMPAVLGEFGFMDSTTDTPIILTEEYADRVADGIVAALVEVYDLKEDEDMVRFNTIAEIKQAAGWAEPTIRKMIRKGFIAGSGKKDAQGLPADMDLSMDMIRMMVMNDAAGVYGT